MTDLEIQISAEDQASTGIFEQEDGPKLQQVSSNIRHIMREYLEKNDPIYAELSKIRIKGWEKKAGDEHFKQQREKADSGKSAKSFYRLMQVIADDMQSKTKAFTKLPVSSKDVRVLDLCMAPGAYTACALRSNPGAQAFGITLPPTLGGHEILFKADELDVKEYDITMLAGDLGVDDIPSTHPESSKFISHKVLPDQTFHLVICDGQKLRTYQMADHRVPQEALRLMLSQLIIAMHRIATDGTIVMLLHKLDSYRTAALLRSFISFSSVKLFKTTIAHRDRNSFMMIAQKVQPNSAEAKTALATWRKAWWIATFGGDNGTGEKEIFNEADVQNLLDSFGERLIKYGRPLWKIQLAALKNSPWMKGS